MKDTIQHSDEVIENYDSADQPDTGAPNGAKPTKWSTATIVGDLDQPWLDSEASLLLGKFYEARHPRNTQDGRWKTDTKTWRQWLEGGDAAGKTPAWGLLRHPVAKDKEGACIVLGTSVDGARKAAAMERMYALGLDIDTGARVDAVVAKIQELGLTAIVYTTFSHGKSGLQLKRDDVLKKLKINRDPTIGEIREYMATYTKSRYEPDFIADVSIKEQKVQTSKGVVIELDTPRIEKFRVIFPLKEPVTLIELAETQVAALAVWADAVTGVAVNMLGVSFDVSCTDPSRLFFTPRHPEGGEYRTTLINGNLLDFSDIELCQKSHYTKKRENNPFLLAGDDGQDSVSYFTPAGVSLNSWHRKARERFLIADLLSDHCPDKIRVAGGEKQGSVHLECPFEDEHSEAGGTATMAINCLDTEHGSWTVFCHHDACQGRRPLAYLERMLQDEWFSEELLSDETYLLPAEDEDEDADETPTERAERKRGEPLTYHRVNSPLYDFCLVDADGFIWTPEKAKPLYSKLGFKFTEGDQTTIQSAYRKMITHVEDAIETAMRQRFDYVVFPKETQVAIRTAPGKVAKFYSETALKGLYANQEVRYLDGEKVKTIVPAEVFRRDRKRVTYSETCFEPDPSQADPETYNLWTGFAVAPVEGDWSFLRNHVRDVVCSGDEQLFAWVMTYAASIFARPGVKIPSSIVLKGEQETGKSIFFDEISKAMGATALKVSEGKHIAGGFNGHLDGKLFLLCEETLWAGDKAAAGVLKDLITADTLTVEAKFENAVTRPNRLAIVFVSNNEWVIPTDGEDARRFLVLDVPPTHKKDKPYFLAIIDQMKRGGRAAMVHELTYWDPAAVGLTWDDLRHPPKTAALREQAGMGLSGPMAELVRMIEEGEVSGRTRGGEFFHYTLSDTSPTRVGRSHLLSLLSPKKERGNVAKEAANAIEKLLGVGTYYHDNRTHLTYSGPATDVGRAEISTDGRVPFVEFPPLEDLKPRLAAYGRV